MSTGMAARSSLHDRSRFRLLTEAVERLLARCESDTALVEPSRLRERLEALDRLDVYFPCSPAPGAFTRLGQDMLDRANTIRSRLEIINGTFYESIRCQIQGGLHGNSLIQSIPKSLTSRTGYKPASGFGYDYFDELLSGVFRFQEPDDRHIPRDVEKMPYQPTPARHIFDLIDRTALTAADVFVDLGSGLGHVAMMVSIITRACSLGIEVEAPYVERAQQCARSLNLNRVVFVHEDAREADLRGGTLFYLFTPFVGSVLRAVLNRLKHEAAARPIRICCFGPCAPIVAAESWLVATTLPRADFITMFCSRA